MKGLDLKNRLLAAGYTVTAIANKVGVIPQNINGWFTSNDVRTGTVEKLAEVLGLPISFFYGEGATTPASNVTGSNNATATGNNNTVNNSDDRLLTLLLNKDEQLTMAMRQTSKAQEQMDVVIAELCDRRR